MSKIDQLYQQNMELVGRKFIHEAMTGRPECIVLGVVETFPQDVVFRSLEPGVDYTHVEFASLVRRNLICAGDCLCGIPDDTGLCTLPDCKSGQPDQED